MPALCLPFRKALATNSTSTSFTAQNATTTEPSGDGVIDLLSSSVGVGMGVRVPSYIQLLPFGTDGANDTFDMRVWGYVPTTDATKVYIPFLLVDLSVVLGAATATPIAANTLLADTLTVNDGPADNGPWRVLIDAQEDLVATATIHTFGCRYLKFDWDLAGAQEGVSVNCLWRPVEV